MSTIINYTQSVQAPSTDYRLWSSRDIIEWIISLNSDYEKYKQSLITSFQDNNFNGSDIDDLDNADLKDFGIINLNDRNMIYKEMQKLIVERKRRDSQENSPEIDDEIMASPRLSDQEKESEDDNDMPDNPAMLIRAISQHYSYHEPSSGEESEEKELEEMGSAIDYYASILLPREQFLDDFYGDKGFTEWIHDPRYEQTIALLTTGYIRKHSDHKQETALPVDIHKIIVNYYSINTTLFHNSVEIQSGPKTFFTVMAHISLSKILVSRAKQPPVNHIDIKQREVKPEILEYILEYLAHHKESEFEHTLIWTNRNSMNTDQIVSDDWDRQWINTFDLNTLSLIKEAARYLKIISLVQLAGIPMITQLFNNNMAIFLDNQEED